jgi:hypothetical protein
LMLFPIARDVFEYQSSETVSKQFRSNLEADVDDPHFTAALEMFRLTQIRRTTPAESFTTSISRGFNPSRTALFALFCLCLPRV